MQYAPALNVCAKCALRTVILNSATVTWGSGLAFSYQITGKGTPTIFSATGLPSGLSINTSTGVISGTTTSLGSHPITITGENVRNSVGTATLTLVIVNGYVAVTANKVVGGSPNNVLLNLEISTENEAFVTVDTSKTYYIFTTGTLRTTLISAANLSSGGSTNQLFFNAPNADVTLKTTSNVSITSTGATGSLNVSNLAINSPSWIAGINEFSPTDPYASQAPLTGTLAHTESTEIVHNLSLNGTMNTCVWLTEINI